MRILFICSMLFPMAVGCGDGEKKISMVASGTNAGTGDTAADAEGDDTGGPDDTGSATIDDDADADDNADEDDDTATAIETDTGDAGDAPDGESEDTGTDIDPGTGSTTDDPLAIPDECPDSSIPLHGSMHQLDVTFDFFCTAFSGWADDIFSSYPSAYCEESTDVTVDLTTSPSFTAELSCESIGDDLGPAGMLVHGTVSATGDISVEYELGSGYSPSWGISPTCTDDTICDGTTEPHSCLDSGALAAVPSSFFGGHPPGLIECFSFFTYELNYIGMAEAS